jgi:hypothetical protein
VASYIPNRPNAQKKFLDTIGNMDEDEINKRYDGQIRDDDIDSEEID